MKKLLLLTAALVSVLNINARVRDEKIRRVDLTGSWKEAARYSRLSERVNYDDTTFYDFLIGNEYTVQRKNSYMYRGTYKVTSGILDFGMRTYNIVEMDNDRMLLKDDGGTYQFVRYDKAATLRENNDAADNGDRGYKEDLNGTKVRASQLSGKWEVYKRTSSEKVPEVDYTKLIRVIEMKTDGQKLVGSVSSAKDTDGSPSWKISGYENGTIFCTGKYNRELKVLKCRDNDLIIEEGITTYFFKQFK